METLKRNKISFVFRHKLPENSSIEELFSSLMRELKRRELTIEKIELPQAGISFKTIYKNLQYIRSFHSDLFHITGDIHYISPVLKRTSILTVHDVGSALKGSLWKQFLIKLFWFWIPSVFVHRFTVISNTSKKELLKIIPYAEKKITVIYNPVSPNIEESVKTQIGAIPTILHLGTKSNKNLERTIKALNGINCKLIIIGKLTNSQRELLEINNINFKNEFHLPFHKIIEHYHNCDLVTFISTYEGFGMPIIEAQKVGRPVITSNISSMPEIAGDGALFVDPFDIDEIKDAVIRIIENKQLREELVKKGLENVKRFDIGTITGQYIDLYNKILEK